MRFSRVGLAAAGKFLFLDVGVVQKPRAGGAEPGRSRVFGARPVGGRLTGHWRSGCGVHASLRFVAAEVGAGALDTPFGRFHERFWNFFGFVGEHAAADDFDAGHFSTGGDYDWALTGRAVDASSGAVPGHLGTVENIFRTEKLLFEEFAGLRILPDPNGVQIIYVSLSGPRNLISGFQTFDLEMRFPRFQTFEIEIIQTPPEGSDPSRGPEIFETRFIFAISSTTPDASDFPTAKFPAPVRQPSSQWDLDQSHPSRPYYRVAEAVLCQISLPLG